MTAQQWLFEVAEGREVRVSNLVLWEVDFGFINVVFALQSFPIDVQWPKKKAKHKKEHDIEWYSSTSHFNIDKFDEKKWNELQNCWMTFSYLRGAVLKRTGLSFLQMSFGAPLQAAAWFLSHPWRVEFLDAAPSLSTHGHIAGMASWYHVWVHSGYPWPFQGGTVGGSSSHAGGVRRNEQFSCKFRRPLALHGRLF